LIIVGTLNFLYRSNPISGYDYPQLMKIFFITILSLRLVDIIQTWWHLTFVPKLEAKAPRIIFIVLLNYIEIAIIFGVIGHLCKSWPYYTDSQLQIWDALRWSVGTLTPLGIAEKPSDISKAALFYTEYAIGLFFLVVIINVVISFLTKDIKETNSDKNK